MKIKSTVSNKGSDWVGTASVSISQGVYAQVIRVCRIKFVVLRSFNEDRIIASFVVYFNHALCL